MKSLILFSLIVSTAAFADDIYVGKKAPVARFAFVVLENAVENANNTFPVGANCGIRHGAMVEVLKLDDELQQALVRYEIGEKVKGSLCPEGAEFLAPYAWLSNLTSDYFVVMKNYQLWVKEVRGPVQ